MNANPPAPAPASGPPPIPEAGSCPPPSPFLSDSSDWSDLSDALSPCPSVLLSLNSLFSSGDFPLSNLNPEIQFPRHSPIRVHPRPSAVQIFPAGISIKPRKSMVQITSNNVQYGPKTSGICPKWSRNVPRYCPLSPRFAHIWSKTGQ
jgi:hypothetical protein